MAYNPEPEGQGQTSPGDRHGDRCLLVGENCSENEQTARCQARTAGGLLWNKLGCRISTNANTCRERKESCRVAHGWNEPPDRKQSPSRVAVNAHKCRDPRRRCA